MGHYVAYTYVPTHTPGGLLRKPPLKCVPTCTRRSLNEVELTQHGYVAARWIYDPVWASVSALCVQLTCEPTHVCTVS